MNNILKNGSCSVVLGSEHYKSLCERKKNKLLKISNVFDDHNEMKYISMIKTIKDYDKYYSLPDEVSFLLKPTHPFYKYISKIVNDSHIFNGDNLHCFYVDYAGNKELIDIINELNNYKYVNYWNSYASVLKFTKNLVSGLKYLHEKKICHLDIKPENIVINTEKKTVKIIDFGFSSMEPFDDFVHNVRGTPCYFPKYVPGDEVTEWFPPISANDTKPRNNTIDAPFVKNRQLVYKIDSYCLGRVLHFLKYFFDKSYQKPFFSCIVSDEKNNQKLNKIIELLLKNDAEERISVIECYNYFF